MIKFKTTKKTNYYVSEEGDIYSETIKLGVKRKIKPREHKDYLIVMSKRPIHRIVATAYHPNPENKPQVNHKDGNKKNNHKNNVEWATAYENNNHAFATGLNNNKKLSDEDVLALVEEYRSGKFSSRDLSAKWGVCDRLVMAFALGKERKHLNIIPCANKFAAGRKRKYSNEVYENIRSLMASGLTTREIGAQMGVSRGIVKGILYGYKNK